MINKQQATSNNIQLLRGIAIIAVVLIHNSPEGLLQVFIRPFLNFAVGLFLFLSGMLSNIDKWKPKKRIMKIIIPYVLWTLIYSILNNNIVATPTQISAQFVKNVLTARGAAIMYYVFVYCQFTLLIPVIDKFAKSKYKHSCFFIAPAEIILMRMIPVVIGFSWNNYVYIVMSISFLGWFTYFYLGYMMGNGLFEIKISTIKLFNLLVLTIILQNVEGYWYWTMGNANCGTQLKLSSLLTNTIFLILAYRFVEKHEISEGRVIKALKFIGDISFGIYFLHLAVMNVLKKLPIYSKIDFFPSNGVAVLVVSAVCVLVGRKILGKYSKYFAL